MIGRAHCHLCDDMRVAVQGFAREHRVPLALQMVDLDDLPMLEARFGALVPVLLLGVGTDGVEICQHRLDENALRAAIS